MLGLLGGDPEPDADRDPAAAPETEAHDCEQWPDSVTIWLRPNETCWTCGYSPGDGDDGRLVTDAGRNVHANALSAQLDKVEDPDLRVQLGLTDAGPDQEPPADTQVPHCRDCAAPLDWQREDGALCPTCATEGGDGDE